MTLPPTLVSKWLQKRQCPISAPDRSSVKPAQETAEFRQNSANSCIRRMHESRHPKHQIEAPEAADGPESNATEVNSGAYHGGFNGTQAGNADGTKTNTRIRHQVKCAIV